MNKVLIHVPHSSLKVSNKFRKKMLLSNKEFNEENYFMCDYKINKCIPFLSNNIVFKYSRIMCDVERYRDSKLEEMNKYGMGYIYEYTSLKKKILEIDKLYKEYIDKIYERHHGKIHKRVTKILNKYNECILIDLHSYSDETVKRIFNKENNPDICLGVNNFYDKKLLNSAINYFNKYGYTTKINYPYAGSLIPNEYCNDNRIKSMMIEVNKRVFDSKMKKLIKKYLKMISSN